MEYSNNQQSFETPSNLTKGEERGQSLSSLAYHFKQEFVRSHKPTQAYFA